MTRQHVTTVLVGCALSCSSAPQDHAPPTKAPVEDSAAPNDTLDSASQSGDCATASTRPDAPDSGTVLALEGVAWHEQVGGVSPSPRSDTAAIALGAPGEYLLFGGWHGEDQQQGYLDGTWVAHGAESGPVKWMESHPTESPVARKAHCMAFDAVGGRAFVFAGMSYKPFLGLPDWTKYDKMFNDVWVLNGKSNDVDWALVSPAGDMPATRAGAQCAYDSLRNRLVVFGGLAWSGTGVDGSPD
ncbi:MAG: hypothetical protein AMXMBFR64_37940 [Myxococcales bacterium]